MFRKIEDPEHLLHAAFSRS